MIRFLFDQNISFRVVKQLKAVMPGSVGVRDVGLYEADDFAIWEYARRENYVVVTFDKDIPMIGAVKGFPPKIIWLRTGNMSNKAIVDLSATQLDEFIDFNTRQKKAVCWFICGRKTLTTHENNERTGHLFGPVSRRYRAV